MIALPLALCGALAAPQSAPRDAASAEPARAHAKSDAWVVTGVTVDGQLPLAALRLGDGGIVEFADRGNASGAGSYLTRGGVRIRARLEGVKLDFPSGAELLIDARSRVHERGGRATPVDPNGVEIRLTDGVVVRAFAEAGGRGRALRWVHVSDGEDIHAIWHAGRPMSRAALTRPFHGRSYAALGDGSVLYEIAQLGPMVVATRGLCPRDLQDGYPERAIVLAGDVLGRSLVELQSVAMQRAATRPKIQGKAQALAGLALRMFEPGTVKFRPSGAVGRLEIPVGGRLHLDIEMRQNGSAVIALRAAEQAVPMCEWHVLSNTTLLHLIEQRKRDEDPHFAMQGFDLRHLTRPLLPFATSPTAVARARRVVIELGG